MFDFLSMITFKARSTSNADRLILLALLSLPHLIACAEDDQINQSSRGVLHLLIEGTPATQGEKISWKSDETTPRDGDGVASNDPQEPSSELNQGLPVLGSGLHTLDAVQLTLIGSERNGLKYPRDLAFNPERPDELWVVNQSDDSAVIFEAIGTDKQRSLKVIDPAADHFMEEVSSLAFGRSGRFATCQESGNTYNNRANPNLFMGPTLWSSDFEVFGQTNPEAVRYQGFDLGSHLDMLHESPYCTGIAWAWDEAYWVFEGMTESITLVDFRQDHGPGFDDHSDGVMHRYARGQVKRVPGIPSHMVYDATSGLLWIADTGNHRLATLNAQLGGDDMIRQRVIEPGTTLLEVMDHPGVVTVPGTQDLVETPSGIALHDGLIYITDASSGLIVALTPKGEVVDWLNTGAPGLFGLTFDAQGSLYVVHGPENLLVKISPRQSP